MIKLNMKITGTKRKAISTTAAASAAKKLKPEVTSAVAPKNNPVSIFATSFRLSPSQLRFQTVPSEQPRGMLQEMERLADGDVPELMIERAIDSW
jgi:hypothetical protein